MSTLSATIGVLFVTLLWGSWFQTVKHIKEYPVHAFITLMYALSIPVVWLPVFFFNGTSLIPTGIINEISSNYALTSFIFVMGICFGIGMQMHLSIVKKIGLILSTSVSATCAILGGTIVSIIFAKLPEGVSAWTIIFASILLIIATILCQYAGVNRDKELGVVENTTKTRTKDVLSLAFINLVLMSSYPLANSLGLRTATNPNGFSSLTCMGIMVIGAFIGSLTITLFKSKCSQRQLIKQSGVSFGKLFVLALIAACCHFGGNVLHTFFAPVISVTLATALGNSYHLWSYVWGIFYGEFKGSSVKTYTLLASGAAMFIIGVLIISLKTV